MARCHILELTLLGGQPAPSTDFHSQSRSGRSVNTYTENAAPQLLECHHSGNPQHSSQPFPETGPQAKARAHLTTTRPSRTLGSRTLGFHGVQGALSQWGGEVLGLQDEGEQHSTTGAQLAIGPRDRRGKADWEKSPHKPAPRLHADCVQHPEHLPPHIAPPPLWEILPSFQAPLATPNPQA